MNASLIFMEIVTFPMNFCYAHVACCCSFYLAVPETWRVIVNQTWFAMASPAPSGAVVTSAACMGNQHGRMWRCRDSSSNDLTEELKTSQEDVSQLYLVY